MKKFLTMVLLLVVGGLTSSAQLFPRVDKPASADASMLVVQFAHDDNGTMRLMSNMNFTGWAPAVKGPDGAIVPFRTFDAGADITNIYYSENLTPGVYTLIGFYHDYTDYSKLDEYRKIKGPNYLAEYGPFKGLPYHVKQLIILEQAVEVTLEANKMQTFGSYAITYKWLSGVAGTTDDRWKVVEEETKFTLMDTDSDYLLRYMKTWATPAWKKWNAKNNVQPLE